MDSERLARYITGEASSSERSEVETWAMANPSNRAELTRLELAWERDVPRVEWNTNRAWEAVAGKLDRTVIPADVDVIPLPQRNLAPRWLAAAAVLLVAGGAAWFALRDRAVEYQTVVGQQRTVSLADGSQVILAPASRLVVESGYAKPVRNVSLTGRAWFVVTHDEKRPFRVTTPDAVVEDLGTEFEVDATRGSFQVAVATGKVAIHRTGSASLTLTAGDMARIAPKQEPTVSHEIAVDRITSWRVGTLDFENRPLREVASELERWYDVVITMSPEVADKPFSGTLPTDRIEQALSTIGTAFTDLNLSRNGRTVSLARKVNP